MGRRAVAATALVSAPWIAVGVATIYYFHFQYESHARGLTDRLTTIQAVEAMQDVLWRLQANVLEVVERADSHTRIEVTELEDSFERHLAEAESRSLTLEMQAMATTIREQFATYRGCIHRASTRSRDRARSTPLRLRRRSLPTL